MSHGSFKTLALYDEIKEHLPNLTVEKLGNNDAEETKKQFLEHFRETLEATKVSFTAQS